MSGGLECFVCCITINRKFSEFNMPLLVFASKTFALVPPVLQKFLLNVLSF